MIEWIRHASKPILWAVVTIVIVSFAFWGDFKPTGKVSRDVVGRIEGKPLDLRAYQASLREAQIGFYISEGRVAQGAEAERIVKERAWHRLLLLNEADKFGVAVSKEELENAILMFPAFQAEGIFNPQIFNNFRNGLLPNLGISYRDFEQMMRNDLRIQRTIDFLSSGILVSDTQVQEQLDKDYSVNHVEVAEAALDSEAFKEDIAEDTLRLIYDSRKAQLLSPQKRNLFYVKFPFDSNDAEARLKAWDEAMDFSIALLDEKGAPVKDFEGTASNAGLTVDQTGPVSQEEASDDTALSQIIREGFRLSKDSPDSNVLETADAFYVIRLGEILEPRQLEFEEAKERLKTEHLKQQAMNAAFIKVQTARAKIEAGLSEGKSFQDLARATGLKVSEVPRLVPSEAMDSRDIELISLVNIVSGLQQGEMSQPQSFGDSVKLVYLRERKSAEEPETLRATIRERLYQRERDMILAEWLANTLRGDTRLDVSF